MIQELTYEEVIDIIENKRRFGNLTGVEISTKMLEQLGNPQQELNVIHIAGTNGKGSVSAFLCSILQEAGLKVGMFTSPHLIEFRERIQVNGTMISKEDCTRIGQDLLHQEFGVYPTMFDYCMVMAVLYFKEMKCDVVIMETGLGGRCDSTNALGTPAVSVITKIGYDHMAILGDTLEQIAGEKAGIIKKESMVVIESQEPEAEAVLKAAAKQAKSCVWVEKGKIVPEGMTTEGQTFSYQDYQHISTHILGVHQYENATAAMLAATLFFDLMQQHDKKLHMTKRMLQITQQNTNRQQNLAQNTQHNANTQHNQHLLWIKQGMKKARWMGRMEILSQQPFFMVDGAHNSHGVTALRDSLCALFPKEKFHFIMAVMADKDYEKMVECLLPFAIDFKTVTVESTRALQADTLASYIKEQGVAAKNYASLEDCLKEKPVDKFKTIAFGSLYFIGEIEAKNKQETLQKSYNID